MAINIIVMYGTLGLKTLSTNLASFSLCLLISLVIFANNSNPFSLNFNFLEISGNVSLIIPLLVKSDSSFIFIHN